MSLVCKNILLLDASSIFQDEGKEKVISFMLVQKEYHNTPDTIRWIIYPRMSETDIMFPISLIEKRIKEQDTHGIFVGPRILAHALKQKPICCIDAMEVEYVQENGEPIQFQIGKNEDKKCLFDANEIIKYLTDAYNNGVAPEFTINGGSNIKKSQNIPYDKLYLHEKSANHSTPIYGYLKTKKVHPYNYAKLVQYLKTRGGEKMLSCANTAASVAEIFVQLSNSNISKAFDNPHKNAELSLLSAFYRWRHTGNMKLIEQNLTKFINVKAIFAILKEREKQIDNH